MDVESSPESFTSWIEAHQAGNAALLDLVSDSRIGPRANGEDEGSSPVGENHAAINLPAVDAMLSAGG